MLKRQLDIQVENVDSVAVVSLAGAIDPTNVDDFKSALKPLCSEPPAVVLLDCGDLSYVSSTSLGLLFYFHRICQASQGTLALCCVWDKIQNILRLLGLDTVLRIYKTREDGVKSLQEEAKKAAKAKT